MTRITNSDQVLMLLRSHLQRAQRGERKSVAAPSRSGPSQTPIERVQNLLRDEELPEPEVERALVRGLLMHEFGTDVSNDAKFQTIVEDVLAMIRRDESANRLLKLAIRQLAER